MDFGCWVNEQLIRSKTYIKKKETKNHENAVGTCATKDVWLGKTNFCNLF